MVCTAFEDSESLGQAGLGATSLPPTFAVKYKVY